jgi:predicted nucleic acid-binding protein
VILLDTNVAVWLVTKSEALHQTCVDACARLVTSGEILVVSAQVLAESWSLLTRPIANTGGFGLSPAEANVRITELLTSATILPEPANIWDEHRHLLLTHAVSGVNVHDCRLAAWCRLRGVERILTLNSAHFKRFGIAAVHPNEV